jgi:hypothetical protein
VYVKFVQPPQEKSPSGVSTYFIDRDGVAAVLFPAIGIALFKGRPVLVASP